MKITIPAFKYAYFLLSVCFLVACGKDSETIFLTSPKPSIEKPGTDYPLVIIDTKNKAIADEPKIEALLTVYENQIVTFQVPIGIELRGSTSQSFPKKSYSIETKDDKNLDKATAFLGLPKEEDFILYGPFTDRTLLRDAISLEIASLTGQYASKFKFVELQLNLNYVGVYVVLEKIKVDENRVNISKLLPSHNSLPELSGGYIIKLDKLTGDGSTYSAQNSFRSQYDPYGNLLAGNPFGNRSNVENYYLYHEPEAELITPSQKKYIQDFIFEFETAVKTFNPSVLPRTYEKYMDVNSFVSYMIANEISGNVDAYRLSTFLHKDRNGPLKFGPVWDFNISYGVEPRSRWDRWIFDYNTYEPQDYWLVHFYWKKLMNDPPIRAAFKAKWNAMRKTLLSNVNLESMVKTKANTLVLSGAMDRNNAKWNVLSSNLPFNSLPVPTTYIKEVDQLVDWTKKRAEWIDSQVKNW